MHCIGLLDPRWPSRNYVRPRAAQLHLIRQSDDAYGVWRLIPGQRIESIKSFKVRGNLSTSIGEIAVNCARDGHSALMRAKWDIAKHLRCGQLVQFLENYRTQPAVSVQGTRSGISCQYGFERLRIFCLGGFGRERGWLELGQPMFNRSF